MIPRSYPVLHAQDPSSASSSLNFGVEPLQFHAGVLEAELPVDAALSSLRCVGPSGNVDLPFGPCADATVAQTLAREATQFAFGDMQPTAVFRGVAKGDSFDVGSCPGRFEGVIERSCGVRVEVVAPKGHVLAIGLARVPQLSNCARPVGFGPSDAGGRVPEARERCGAHEHASRAMARVCVVDTPAMRPRRGDWHPRLLEPLDRLFVPAPHGMLRIVGFRRGFEHCFHTGHELGVWLRRHHPGLDLPLRHAVFFSTLRTVS